MGKRKSYRLDNSSSEKYRKAIITLYKSFGQATVLVVMTRKGLFLPHTPTMFLSGCNDAYSINLIRKEVGNYGYTRSY
ncbi:hypothetical protein RBTH_04228 [Bacillus thuringiensis serovar israelensis ATCC 35646]|nr:hypothetical protein RBTH_04228 [Bacillus thuringiensis serovar israelensis ATCC 35646]